MPDLYDEALIKLRSTHEAGTSLLAASHIRAEAAEVAIEVERHRWFWRPSNPRILLVAESHVFTSDEDLKIKIDQTKISQFGRANASPPPESFVRLVYCLGYGETQLLANATEQFNNPGTPRYWDIFGRLTGRGPQPRPPNEDGLNERLRWKVKTLRQMYRRGIWLLDASVHAIYLGYDHRLPQRIQDELHRQWWSGYGRQVIESCIDSKVWVIGSTVFNCLSNLPGWRWRRWIYQPNFDTETYWPELLEDCGQ